jgi:hypothetical protein
MKRTRRRAVREKGRPRRQSCGRARPRSAPDVPHRTATPGSLEVARRHQRAELPPREGEPHARGPGELARRHAGRRARQLEGQAPSGFSHWPSEDRGPRGSPRHRRHDIRERDVLDAEPAAAAHHHGFLEHRLELAHVPGPRIAGETLEGPVPHTLDREPVAGGELLADVLDEEREVLDPRPERRDREHDAPQPVRSR